MVLKKHKDKPWEWEDRTCFLQRLRLRQHHGQAECDGVMELKDVNLRGASTKVLRGEVYHEHVDPYLEKIWVCNKCGFVFAE